jgi:hypothetical protein
MHDSNNWQFAVTLGAIVVGVFINNRKADDVRRELHTDISLLTGKFIDLIDRLAKVEAKLETK